MFLTICVAVGACSHEVVVFKPAGNGPDGGAAPVARDAATATDAAATDGLDATVPSRARALGIGLDHSCVIEAGALYCWGKNDHGQLGVGDNAVRATPARVGTRTDWVDVCAGEEHSCGLRSDGSALCWGKNLHGELGVGDKDPRSLPTQVEGSKFVRLACGGYTTCGLQGDGSMHCWGDNWEGKLGQNDAFNSPDRAEPNAVMGGLSFRDLSVGQGNVVGVTRDGALYCWGRNSDGQCGTQPDVVQFRVPTRVGTDDDFARASTGMRQTCAIKVDGRLYCWGTDTEGSLGLAVATDTRKNEPLQVGVEADWAEVRVLWFHTCATRENGALYCWGRNAEGQLGLGDIEARSTPQRVGGATDWSRVEIGKFHSCGLRSNGLWCWGINGEVHQLGLGDGMRRAEPTEVTLP